MIKGTSSRALWPLIRSHSLTSSATERTVDLSLFWDKRRRILPSWSQRHKPKAINQLMRTQVTDALYEAVDEANEFLPPEEQIAKLRGTFT